MITLVLDYSCADEIKSVDESVKELMISCIKSVLETEGLEGKYEVSLTVADKQTIKSANLNFRGIDKVTDVLSFPLGDEGDYPENLSNGAFLLGDIMICAPRAAEQAEEYGHSFAREMGFLCVHSALHLLGYDHVGDEQQAKKMRSREREALEKIGLRRE